MLFFCVTHIMVCAIPKGEKDIEKFLSGEHLH